jgi:hypothetical protein
MANIRVKDLPNTSAPAADTDEFIIDSSSAGTRRLNYGELKTAISGDFQSGTSTYKVATLGSDNKLDPAQIPDSLAQGMNFVGVANSAGDLTSTTQGDFYVIQTAFGVYSVGDQAVYDGSAYIRVTDGTKQISEGGTGATTLDAAKLNLEIIDIGTAPNQVPTMGMLGTMSLQDAAGVSIVSAEVETLEVTDKVTGQLGVGASPSYDLHVTNTSSSAAIGITGTGGSKDTWTVTSSDGGGKALLNFRDEDTGNTVMSLHQDGNVNIGGTTFAAGKLRVEDSNGNHVWLKGRSSDGNASVSFRNNADSAYNGRIAVDDSTGMNFQVAGSTRWTINTTGNLVAGANLGIDFGSTNTNTGVTVTGSTLDHYESGTWTPDYQPLSGSYATMTVEVVRAVYCRVGDLVYASAYIRTNNVDTTGGSGGVVITGLPFTSESNNTFNPITIGYASGWVTNPNGGYVTPNTNYIRLVAKTAVTGDHSEANIAASSFTSGANVSKNLLIFSATYRTA